MKGAYLKLLRARQIAELIESEVKKVTDSDPLPGLIFERSDDSRTHRWRIQVAGPRFLSH